MDVPIGTVVAYAGPTNKIPQGWLACDGRELKRKGEFEGLFNALGTIWGGTAIANFRIPDLRGRFLRGVDGGAERDPDVGGRTPAGTAPASDVGSLQGHSFLKHKHGVTDPGHQHRTPWGHRVGSSDPAHANERSGEGIEENPPITTVNKTGIEEVDESGGAETRPINAYVYWIIRAK